MPSGGEASAGLAGDGAALIGLDWGTSNLRILRIAPGGALLAARSDPRGAGSLGPSDFAPVLAEVAADWLDDGLPILACGMVGGRGKWREMPYTPAPAGLDSLAAALDSAPDRPDVRIVPGVQSNADGRMIDVMRGEETQVMGLDLASPPHRVVAPGTHSKWIAVRSGLIHGHRTFMTGELFSALRRGTLLGHGMADPSVDADAFTRGVERSLDDRALTAALFSVRVEVLAGRLPPEASADYLSGLLIGTEIAAQTDDLDSPVVMVGSPELTGRYAVALNIAGFSRVRVADAATATARGLWRIHEAGL